MQIWVASLAAVAVQPLVVAARMAPDYFASATPLYGLGFLLLSAVVVAAAVVLLLGIPTFLVLRRINRASWTSLALAGFSLGAIPSAVLSWPRHLAGFSSGQNWHGTYVDIYINGQPTKFAWLTFGENVAFFGIHGLVGALVFYGVWRKLSTYSHA